MALAPQRGDMSIENGVFNSCTPAECYVYKQMATCVRIGVLSRGATGVNLKKITASAPDPVGSVS